MPQERLQKLIAQAGIASRRAAEELIAQGRVTVNGQPAKVGDKADPAIDLVRVDGELLKTHGAPLVYLMLNKPTGIVTAVRAQRQEKRRTVLDLVQTEERVYPVGRLDADSEGLMVLTDDGDLANRLAHPRYQHHKTYKVVVYGLPSAETIRQWSKGVSLEDEETGERFLTAPCSVQIVDGGRETTLRIVMTEGKKRQIRRVASMLGHPVKSLTRTHIGRLGLGTLRPGEWRELTPKDVEALKARSPEWNRPAVPDRPRGGPAQKPPPRSRPSNRRDTGRRKR